MVAIQIELLCDRINIQWALPCLGESEEGAAKSRLPPGEALVCLRKVPVCDANLENRILHRASSWDLLRVDMGKVTNTGSFNPIAAGLS